MMKDIAMDDIDAEVDGDVEAKMGTDRPSLRNLILCSMKITLEDDRIII